MDQAPQTIFGDLLDFAELPDRHTVLPVHPLERHGVDDLTDDQLICAIQALSFWVSVIGFADCQHLLDP